MQCNRVALAARSAGILVLAVLLALVPVASAPASDAHERAKQILIPSAGWDGRPIVQPHRHDVVRTSSLDRPLPGWAAGPVAFGAGFHTPGGSDRVREVQRRLSRLGYHVGPVDGLFGRLTRASVAWFQLKHGLDVDGRATLNTVRHLRARTGGAGVDGSRTTSRAVAHTDAKAPETEPWEAFNQLVGPRRVISDATTVPESGGKSDAQILLLSLAAVDLLLLLALLLQRRSQRAAAGKHGARARIDEPQPKPAAAVRRPTGRFAPPEPAVEPRPPARVPRGVRNEEPVRGHE
jgi:peptidoglycan hydrolase-like protein with peptidoglycan-binding domain